jgi:hypothetical protein
MLAETTRSGVRLIETNGREFISWRERGFEATVRSVSHSFNYQVEAMQSNIPTTERPLPVPTPAALRKASISRKENSKKKQRTDNIVEL